jgi:hypothetical protein
MRQKFECFNISVTAMTLQHLHRVNRCCPGTNYIVVVHLIVAVFANLVRNAFLFYFSEFFESPPLSYQDLIQKIKSIIMQMRLSVLTSLRKDEKEGQNVEREN